MENDEGEEKNEMFSSSCDYMQSYPGHGLLMLQQLNVQRYYGYFCDITIRIDDIEYRAHRCILAASSAKLQSLISSIRQEWNNVLVIKDVTSTAFQVILNYIYTGNVRLVATSVHDVLESARFLKMPEVEKVCLAYIECMHSSSDERNNGNSSSLRLMPELAPIAEVQIDSGQISSSLSKTTEVQSFDAVTNAFERTGSARNQALLGLYGSKSGLPIFSPGSSLGISIDSFEDYMRLFEMRQNSLNIASSSHQNWSPFLDVKTTESEIAVHRVLPNLVRISDHCSLHSQEDQVPLVSDEGQRVKFSGCHFDKFTESINQKKNEREENPAAGLGAEMFDLDSTDENHEVCAAFLKLTSASPTGHSLTAINGDEDKTKLHLRQQPASSCVPFVSHRVIENFGQMRCENVNLIITTDDFGGSEVPQSKPKNCDSTKRNRKKVPKKLRAARASSSDESNCASNAYDDIQFPSAAVNSIKFPLSSQDASVFASGIQGGSDALSNGCNVLGSLVGLEKPVKNSMSRFSDVKVGSSKHTKKSNNHKIKNAETKNFGAPHTRPFKRKIRINSKRESRESILFSCSFCSRRFGRSCELTRHQRSHSLQLYHCPYCPAEFTNPIVYKRHFISIHGERNAFFCTHPSCKFRSDRLSNLEKHAVIHTNIKSFTCPHCGKSFSQDNGLRSHLQSCTKAQTYLCDVCGAKFNHLQSMTSHRRVHTGEKPYRCTDCGSQFADHRNFKRHKRIHENVFPYSCIFCEKRFRHSNSLKSHLSVHDVCPSDKAK